MKISYIHGVCVENDAISNSIRDEIQWLKGQGGHDVHLYTYACEFDDLSYSKVSHLSDVAFDHHFQSSDLVVFHFGVFYPLFDLLAVAPKRAKRLVVFHNITPREFVESESRIIIDKSFQQMSNIQLVDHVICDSQTNLDVLRRSGIDIPAGVLPLAVHIDADVPEGKPSHRDGVVRLSFIGRFVRSKGPGELLEAVKDVLGLLHSVRLELNMIGNLSFSDTELLCKIRESIAQLGSNHGDRARINLLGNATQQTKHRVLRDADLLVLPTYHEGFCVPIVEAFANGLQVIAYSNSNTPAISGGLARLVPTGDVRSLARAIVDASNEITSLAWRGSGAGSYAHYVRRAQDHILQYRPEQVKRRFLKFIRDFMVGHNGGFAAPS